jgi:hypothetical protein
MQKLTKMAENSGEIARNMRKRGKGAARIGESDGYIHVGIASRCVTNPSRQSTTR